MDKRPDILAEHYQKTFELTLKFWESRNRTFLLLLFVIGLGTLLTFKANQADSLLIDFIAGFLKIEDSNRINELRLTFPYSLMQSILLVVIFYLMVQLFHRTNSINRNYDYLGKMEKEIRLELWGKPCLDTISFTRESEHYIKSQQPLKKFIKYSYTGILGLLLVAFLGMRIISDFKAQNYITVIADVLISIPIFIFYLGYAFPDAWLVKLLSKKSA
ncbi:MAG: hypothetical protein AAGA10_28450 [Bacteroidota bacterium]